MASIIKKIKKGRPYYYAVQSARVDGKPRIVWQKYLGSVDAIVRRLNQASPPKPKECVIFEAGGTAVLLCIAQRLGVLEIINEVAPKREQGPSVGHYLLLAAINRALAPCSKLNIADWYEGTILKRLWRYPKKAFSSQRFWDHMDSVSDEAIEDFQRELVIHIKRKFGLDGRVLLYDTTNFFTYLATTNDRCRIAQRGRSKAKRHDLRQVGLALLVTREFKVPLFHRVYAGNVPDVSLFPELAGDLIKRHDEISETNSESTLVFDKGNVSDEAMRRLVIADRDFVAAVPANRAPEFIRVPLDQFQDVPGLPGTQACAVKTIFWGRECGVVVAYTESFFTQQLSGVTNNLVKCQRKLMELEKRLRSWRESKGRGKRPTAQSVKKSVGNILSPQFMKGLFQITVDEENGLPRLRYAVNHTALDDLINERLGRTLLVTSHADWTPKEVIGAYRSLASIEEAFKNMKNIDFLHWQPAYHWTDQKLKVHGFYCVLALLLVSLAHKTTIEAGMDLSLHTMLNELTSIHEIAVLYPQGAQAHRKDHITLTRMSKRQRKLAELFELDRILIG